MSPTPAGAGEPGEVDFYILSDVGPETRSRFACRLAEKIWLLGNRVFVHTPSPHEAHALDGLLWTFREDSFVPHSMLGTHDGAPVTVGDGRDPDGAVDVLINLGDDLPRFAAQIPRAAEIVESSDAGRESGRGRYRGYRSLGFEIRTHEIQGGP